MYICPWQEKQSPFAQARKTEDFCMNSFFFPIFLYFLFLCPIAHVSSAWTQMTLKVPLNKMQNGSSEQLYHSVHSQIFTLPKNTLLYPGHDYKGYTVSTVGEELQYNTRLTKDVETFKSIMANLNLARPNKMDIAVPANLVCGLQDLLP
ncbi:hypothetical protein SAY87_021768 [Trapa incisa]|uniref:Uncharacterized protein n=1 Tax=Trapa incisa TaxID=236973 RepID=A0AAN7JRI1_9MYRT|nr:hypothetical protein SAY87_021768 [Trapa incisa]